MSYVVLARKWRPTQFDEVVGQGHVARTLKNAIEMDRVAHAFLFTGARGVGKTSSARILAKALNCHTEGPTPTPCDNCISCQEITAGHAIDVFEIDGASNRGINEIRELRESVVYAPSRDRFKIYIIDEVHMLTTEAFNALLKTLEEPPPHAKFIFATTEPQKIPVTILSRCQRYDFKRIGQPDIVSHLQHLCGLEEIQAEEGALKVIARQAAGGMRDAVSLLDQIISFAGKEISEAEVTEILGVANRKNLFALSHAVVTKDAKRAVEVIEEIDSYGYDLGQFAAEFLEHCRDLVVLSSAGTTGSSLMTGTELERAHEIVGATTTDVLHRMFDLTSEAIVSMNESGFGKFTFEMSIIRMTHLEPVHSLDLILEQLEVLEKKFSSDVSSLTSRTQTERPASSQSFDTNPRPAKKPTEPEKPPVNDQPKVVPQETARQSAGPEQPSDDPPHPATRQSAPQESPSKPPVNSEKDRAFGIQIPAADRARMDKDERWSWVVDHLRDDHRPLAMQCEHAHVRGFTDTRCDIAFEPQYAELISDRMKLAVVQEVIHALFGDVELFVDRVQEPANEDATIAQDKIAERARMLKELERDVRQNPTIKKAQQLFGVDESEVRVQVKLFDD